MKSIIERLIPVVIALLGLAIGQKYLLPIISNKTLGIILLLIILGLVSGGAVYIYNKLT
ncbi:hypothetical protein ACVQ8P_06750 [Dellaglioa sp. BT-FLS60]